MRQSAAMAAIGLAVGVSTSPAPAQGIGATGAWDCRSDVAVSCPVQPGDGACNVAGADAGTRAFALDFDRGVIVYRSAGGDAEVGLYGRMDIEDRAQSLFYTEYNQVLVVSQAVDGALTVYEIGTAFAPPITDELQIGRCVPR